VDALLRSLLVCSVCHSDLVPQADGLRCSGCERRFAVRDGSPDLTPVPPPDPLVRERWPLWEELQRNGELMYAADPPSSLSVGAREDAARFAAFAKLNGVVLDVGCGPQPTPSYARGFDGTFVGMDPLAGTAARTIPFVQGIAEFVPFRDGTFDRVLFAASLDHVLSPARALSEARRVLRADGAAAIWLGEVPEAPGLGQDLRAAGRLLRSGELRRLASGVVGQGRARLRARRGEAAFETPDGEVALRVPSGAVDAFHFEHPRVETVTAWLEDAGLHVRDVERPFKGSCFIRATPS
jgi:SAM-dependent methyltransferase